MKSFLKRATPFLVVATLLFWPILALCSDYGWIEALGRTFLSVAGGIAVAEILNLIGCYIESRRRLIRSAAADEAVRRIGQRLVMSGSMFSFHNSEAGRAVEMLGAALDQEGAAFLPGNVCNEWRRAINNDQTTKGYS